MAIDADDIAFFEAHGWWLSPMVVAEKELEWLAAEQDRFYRGAHDRANPAAAIPYPGSDPEKDDPHELRKNDYASYRNPVVFDTANRRPAITRIRCSVSENKKVITNCDQFVMISPDP